MNLQTFQAKIAERVRAIPLLAAVPVREEEMGNIVETLRADIEKTSFCVVVGTAGFTDEAPDASACYGAVRVAVTVFEDPELNRRAAGRPTFLNAAQEIAKALKLFRPDVPGAGCLTSPSISEPQDLGDGVVSVVVSLSTKATL